MYAKFLGSFALIASLIFQHSKDESLLKLPHRFRASHTGSIHLQHNTLQLFLHDDFSLTELSLTELSGYERDGLCHHTKQGKAIERGRSQEGKEKAVTLVTL